MKMYFGEDEGDVHSSGDEHSSGAILIETLTNIRTVAAFCLQDARSGEYSDALVAEDPTPVRSNFFKGCGAGLGQFFQLGIFGLQFWFGGWLLLNYPDTFSYRDFLISMFSMLFGMYGLALAAEGAVDREKAKVAAQRIFDLTDRQSAIDPLSEEGRKDL